MFYQDFARCSPGENLGSIATHAAGAVAALAFVGQLANRTLTAGEPKPMLALGLYGATLVFAFGVSAAYHATPEGRLRRVLLLLDYISIYLLIAGTYTPFVLLAVGGTLGWGLFAMFWALAAVGVVGRVAVRDARPLVGTAAYIVIGWSGAVAFGPLRDALPSGAFAMLLAGGGVITLGALVYLWNALPYNHLLWHLLVLFGAGMHAWVVWTTVV